MELKNEKIRYRKANIMFQFQQIPVEVILDWKPGCPYESLRRRFFGAVMTQGLTPEQFRKMARTMLRTGQAELVDGHFKLKRIKIYLLILK